VLLALCSFSGWVFFCVLGIYFSTPGTSWFSLRRSYRNNLNFTATRPCQFPREVP
jgi:hypothetical protein